MLAVYRVAFPASITFDIIGLESASPARNFQRLWERGYFLLLVHRTLCVFACKWGEESCRKTVK